MGESELAEELRDADEQIERLKAKARAWKRLAKLWYPVRVRPDLRARTYRGRREMEV